MTTFIGQTVTLIGPRLTVGDKAPDFVILSIIMCKHSSRVEEC